MNISMIRPAAGVSLAAAFLLLACGRFGDETSRSQSRADAAADNPEVATQQVYHPGTTEDASRPVPLCSGSASANCYGGPLLAVQATGIGFTANEPTLGVASDGTAYFAGSAMVVDTEITWAGARTNIHRSTDGGRTWQSVQPSLGTDDTALPPVNADPLIYLDPATDRIFLFDLLGACQVLSYSDDRGENWTTMPLACGNLPVDHQSIVAAPPVGPIPTIGYPNMLIWCANRIVDGACGRSFDGGLTWTPAGQPWQGVSPDSGLCSALAGHLAADAEGRIYMPSAHCGFPQVSVSSDGGLTWTVHTVSTMASPVAHTSVEVDEAGNVYYVWIDEQQRPFLAWSTDHGSTWSEPLMVAPPDVIKANFPTVAAGAPGRIAINFPSLRAPPADAEEEAVENWDQTLVISENVFAENPVFLSALANDPAQPVHRGPCMGRCGGLWDFLDVQISKDGEAWAAASYDCTGTCQSEAAVINDHSGQGVAIRQIAGPKLR